MGALPFQLESSSAWQMAVDVKSRAKRYEKLDFLGEGQVRFSGGARRALSGERRTASHHRGFSRGSPRTGHATRSACGRLPRPLLRPLCPPWTWDLERPSPKNRLERDVDGPTTFQAAASFFQEPWVPCFPESNKVKKQAQTKNTLTNLTLFLFFSLVCHGLQGQRQEHQPNCRH